MERHQRWAFHYFALLLRTAPLTLSRIAVEMGVADNTIAKLVRSPMFALAREVAKEIKPHREDTFGRYVFRRLSKEGQELWKRIAFWSEHDEGNSYVDRILSKTNTHVRQELFIHALVTYAFDVSRACRMVGVSLQTLETWKKQESFGKLLEEIQFHKKNFFEKAMLDLVAQRNPMAVIYANKTINADRGYGDRVEVQHSISPGFNFADLDLDLNTRRKVLDAIRRRKAIMEGRLLPAPATEAIDVKTVEESAVPAG